AEIEGALSRLPGLIPALRGYTFGPDLGISEGNSDFAVVADVDDADGFVAYRDHPDHQAALGLIKPLLAGRPAVQFVLPEADSRAFSLTVPGAGPDRPPPRSP